MGQHTSKARANKLCKCGPPINLSVKTEGKIKGNSNIFKSVAHQTANARHVGRCKISLRTLSLQSSKYCKQDEQKG